MTEDHYAQTMQASLDDTAGKFQGEYSFEPCSGRDCIGEVRVKKTGALLRTFDAEGLAPDLHLITNARFLFFWVLAASVWSKQKIYRPVRLQELFAIWDYEGKLEFRDLSWHKSIFVLQHRLMSPPGKLVRAIVFTLLESYLEPMPATDSPASWNIGKSLDIKFSPLEEAADVRAEAACADDAEIDLSTWSYVGESELEAAARATLRKVAVRWWAGYQGSLASAWLRDNSNDPRNVSGVSDCMRRIKACKYFKWVRGSRIHFWKIPVDDSHRGWLEEFRDGIKLMQLPGTSQCEDGDT
jgi:hypothetical protein